EELIAVMIDVVLVLRLSHGEELPLGFRCGGRQRADLGGREARHAEEKVRLAARAPRIDAEQLVRLFVDQLIAGGTQAVPVESIRPLGVVLRGVEESLIVRGPGYGADLLETIRK